MSISHNIYFYIKRLLHHTGHAIHKEKHAQTKKQSIQVRKNKAQRSRKEGRRVLYLVVWKLYHRLGRGGTPGLRGAGLTFLGVKEVKLSQRTLQHQEGQLGGNCYKAPTLHIRKNVTTSKNCTITRDSRRRGIKVVNV